MSQEIDNAFGLNPMPLTIYETPKAPNVADQVSHDVDVARDGLFHALQKSQQAVEDLASIAAQSQNAKAYEALNSAINTMTAISMNLAELQLKKQRLEGKNPETKTVNNNLIMTTEELLKQIADRRPSE